MLYKVLLEKKSQSHGSTLKHSRLSEGNLKEPLPSTEIIARAMILQTSMRNYSNQLCIMSENCGNKIRLMHQQNTVVTMLYENLFKR